jgi:hypothetical protein
LPITGADDLRAETGSGSTPRNGAGVDGHRGGGEAAAGQDLRDQPAEGVPDQGRLLLEFADHVAEVVGNLPDTFVREDLGVAGRVLDGVGIIRPARRKGGIASLLEHRPPAIPAGWQQPQPVDKHDRSELRSICFLDLLCFVVGYIRHDVSCPFGSKAAPSGAALHRRRSRDRS